MRKLLILFFLLSLSAAAQITISVANAGTTGTTVNTLTKLTGAPSTAVIAATTDTGGIVGITIAGAGTSGNAIIALTGLASCIFDGATTADDYVQISSTTGGDCHDTGSTTTPTTGGDIIGRVLSSNGAGGTYTIHLFPAEIKAAATTTSVTVNGQTCTLGSTCNVNVGAAAHSVALNQGNGSAQTGVGPGTTGQVLSAVTSSDPVYIDFPDVKTIPSANCNNTTAGAGWSIGSGGTVTCRAGTNNLLGYVTITDTASTFAEFMVEIPEDWDSSNRPYIRFQVASSDTTTGHTIIPQIKVSCEKGDGSTTDDVTFNAAHSLSTTTLNTTANQFWSGSNVQMNATDVTGCVAGAMMIVQVGRATDTATNANFYSATITFPRLLVVQAN